MKQSADCTGVAGELEAVDAVLRHYTIHIKYLSMYNGYINDDTQDRLKTKQVEAILKFRLWVVKRAKSADCFRPQFIIGNVTQLGYFALDLCGFVSVEMTRQGFYVCLQKRRSIA